MAHTPRIYVPGSLHPGPVSLRGEQARHLGTVLRIRPGEEFLVFSGDGHEYRAIVETSAPDAVSATVAELNRMAPAPPLVLEIWCALVRPQRFEWAIEKCTEAGADVIRPLITEHSARGHAPSASRIERWRRIAVEASEQSGRLFVPVVESPARFADVVRPGRVLVAGDATGMSWAEAARLLPPEGNVAVIVGPEGGFSESETATLRSARALLASFGANILRTETAAVVATALVRSAAA